MKMIQITKWLDPEDETWYKGTHITTREWLMIEKDRLEKITNKRVVIRTDPDGSKAIFREKIK
tara:strand:- start:4636 stop:4824 length:189 start_codon:yes stop_codon:yes gene_type:complete